MIVILLIILVCLLAVAYVTNKGDVTGPSFLFMLGFVLCTTMAALFSRAWNFTLSIPTFLVVAIGCALFVVSAWLTNRFFKPSVGRQETLYIDYNIWVVVLFLAIQFITYAMTVNAIVRLYPSTSISASIALYDKASKFALDVPKGLPFPIGPFRNICGAYELLLCFFLAQDLAFKKYTRVPLLFLSFIVGIMIGVQVGGRAPAINYVSCCALCYLIILGRIRGKHIRISPKLLLIALFALLVLVNTFQISLELLGRSSNRDPLEYLAMYIGAQVPNLDYFINNVGSQDHNIFGYMTFIVTIRWLGTKLGLASWVYQFVQPFVYMNGQSMGNVYTTFYSFIYDFGYAGILLSMFMGVTSQIVYRCMKRTKGKSSPIFISVYASLGFVLLMGFYTNWFFEQFFDIPMLRTIGYMIFINLFLTLGKRYGSVPHKTQKQSQTILVSARSMCSSIKAKESV